MVCIADHFSDLGGNAPGVFQAGLVKLEQVRALDNARLKMEAGPLASMKPQPLAALRAGLMGMLEPRLLP